MRATLRQRCQHRAIAWAGLAAIWLAALAPVVSQTLAAARLQAQREALAQLPPATHAQHPASAMPTIVASDAHAAHDHAGHAAMASHTAHAAATPATTATPATPATPAMPAPPAHGHAHGHGGAQGEDPLSACGYCDLFLHSPVAFTLAPLPPAPAPAAPPPPALPQLPTRPALHLVTAAPRGPPSSARIA